MVANLPPQAVTAGAGAPQAAPPAEGGLQLPAGEILAGRVLAPPPGAPQGSMLLALEKFPPALIRAALPLQPGERVAVEAEGKGRSQKLRLIARAGGSEEVLEPLAPGQVRLAQNQALTAGLRSMLATAKGTILGQILGFKNRGSAPVKMGGITANFQLDSGARPGERLLIRAQEAGGALGLRVVARGGRLAAPGPPGRVGLLQIMGGGTLSKYSPSEGSLPAPGSVLTGTLVRVTPGPGGIPGPGGPSPDGPASNVPSSGAPSPDAQSPGGAAQAPGRSAGRSAARSPARSPENPTQTLPRPGARAAAGPPGTRAPQRAGGASASGANSLAGGGSVAGGGGFGGPAAATQGGQTALLRFAGFDAEVPWPSEAARAFPPGAPVRVFVNRVEPVLDLHLLAPPDAGGEYLPTGGAGDSGFGANLISLAEGLAAARGQVPQGEVARVYEGLVEALNQSVIRENALAPAQIREALLQGGALTQPGKPAGEGGGPDLRENLMEFLRVVRDAGLPEGDLLSRLTGQGEQAVTSLEFLQAANGLRHLLDQGTYLQIPFFLGGEQGTLDLVVRRDGERQGGEGERDHHTVVFLLELQGLGPIRVDAALHGKRMHARFTTPNEEVGRFIENELPVLREAMEAQDFVVEGVSWIHDRPVSEPIVPSPEADDPSGENSFINLRV